MWCSVLRHALLCPLLCIIPSMNISLITAEKAEWSRVEDACHTAPSARITLSHLPLTSPCHISPRLQLSKHQHPSFPLTLHTFPLPCQVFLNTLLFLPLSSSLCQILLLLMSRCHLFCPLRCHTTPSPPPHTGWVETLFTMGLLILPY